MRLTFFQRMSIKASHRRDFYRALAKVARNGLSVHEAVAEMAKSFTQTRHPMGPLVAVLMMRLRGAGVSRSEDGRRTLGSELLGLVPFDEAMLVRAGDLSGRIDQGLAHAVNLVETKQRLRSSIVKALIEPGAYLVAFIGLLVFISTDLIPDYERSTPRASWPHSAQMLGFVADHVIIVVAGVIGLIAAVLAAFRWIAPRWSGAGRDWCDRRVFPFTMIAKFSGASVLTSIAGYMSANVSFDKAISNLDETSTPYLKSQCARVQALLKKGKRPHDALCELPIVPVEYHWLIRIYAMSSDAVAAYEIMAAEMVEGTETFVYRVFTYGIAKVMLLAVAAFIAWVYTAFYGIGASSGFVGG